MKPINGIHHVTAIASNAQATHDFYTMVLGLRFVKKTVNFDDPNVYHLYFGDATGKPGTILTFFNWKLPNGTRGTESIQSMAFQVPMDSLDYWKKRLRGASLSFESDTAFQEDLLRFSDPSGLPIELVAQANQIDSKPWEKSLVPIEHAIRGICGVTLSHTGFVTTAEFLENTLGFKPKNKSENGRYRFETGKSFVDVRVQPDAPRAQMGSGSIHHVAFRAKDENHQLEWHTFLTKKGVDVTPVVERFYFKSIYFHEPGGTLFEIATDPPGFLVDQSVEQLGRELTLPPWYEKFRVQIQKQLPELKTE